MTQEEMLHALSTLQINGNISQLCMGDGYMTVNNYPDPQPSVLAGERHTAVILRELLDAKDEEGHRLMTDQQQWYAVYRVLEEYGNYPRQMSDFARAMAQLGMDRATPACKHDSLRKASQAFPRLACKVSQWQQYSSLSEAYAKQCRVAEWLIERME